MVRSVRYASPARLLIFHSQVFLVSNKVAKVDHVLARDLGKTPYSSTLRNVVLQQRLIFTPTALSLFCVSFQAFLLEFGEGCFRTFLRSHCRGIGSVRHGAFGLESRDAGEQYCKIGILAESHTPRSTLDTALPNKTFDAARGNAESESPKLIVADEQLSDLRRLGSFDQQFCQGSSDFSPVRLACSPNVYMHQRHNAMP